MDIIDRINLLLTQRGITGAELSRAIGLSNSVYSQWNTKTTKPSKKNIAKVAKFLGTTVEYLWGGEDDEKTPTPKGERELPHAAYREVLSEGGIRLLLDADAKVPQEHLDDIVEFIKFKQRKNGR